MNPSGSYEFLRRQVYIGLGVPVYTESTYTNSNVPFPVIIFSRRSSKSIQDMQAPAASFDSITFTIKAKTEKKAEDIRDFLIALVNGYDNQISLTSESNSFDMDLAIYNRSLQFRVIYNP